MQQTVSPSLSQYMTESGSQIGSVIVRAQTKFFPDKYLITRHHLDHSLFKKFSDF